MREESSERDRAMGVQSWTRHFRRAVTNIISHRLIHLISIGTICMSLLLLGSFLLLFVNLNHWLSEWGQSLSMSVYIKDGTDQEAVNRIESALKKLPGAKITEFISKQEAMEILIRGLGPHSGLLTGLKENPLPASFEVVFRDVNRNQVQIEKAREYLKNLEGVDEVQYSEQWSERFKGLMYVLRVAGFILGGFLSLAVVFITTNTIKLTIYSRREEIEILKLVGATDWFVKIPFLIEGVLQGIVGGLVAVSVLFSAYCLFSLKSVQLTGLPLIEFVFLPNGYLVFILLLSVFLGLVGSLVAVGRFFNL